MIPPFVYRDWDLGSIASLVLSNADSEDDHKNPSLIGEGSASTHYRDKEKGRLGVPSGPQPGMCHDMSFFDFVPMFCRNIWIV